MLVSGKSAIAPTLNFAHSRPRPEFAPSASGRLSLLNLQVADTQLLRQLGTLATSEHLRAPRLLPQAAQDWETAQGLNTLSARPQWDTAQDPAKFSCCKTLKSQVLASQDLSGRLPKPRQSLALQEPQDPHDARQVLAPQDLSRMLKTRKSSRCPRLLKPRQGLALQELKSHMTRAKSYIIDSNSQFSSQTTILMSPLDSLANELRMHICSFLRPHDLWALMRVNRAFHLLIEPMLYSNMELHRPGYHEHYQYPDAIHSGERRNYHENDAGDYPEDTTWQDSRYTAQAFDFLKVFENPDGDNIQPCVRTLRSQAIANQVRFLCLETDLYHDEQKLVDPWGTIASFRNLEHLELTGATGITDLELALLDRPIGSSNANERKNPLPGWKHIEPEIDGDAWLDGEDEDTASDKDSDGEDFEHEECVAPRALPTLLDSGIDFAAHFSSLTRLTLRRPAESLNPGLEMQGVYVSLKSDLAILSEWTAVIRATRGALEHLVLDQRPFAEHIERDSTGDAEFLVRYPYGPGYERFVEHCLPALFEEIKWPNLKSIRLYGFDVPPEMAEKHSSPVKHQKLGLQVEARFKPLGVDVRSGLGRRMLYEEHDGVVSPYGDGLGGRVEEDEE
ncbi:hypothetical protein B0H14DRAFT_3874506 [Mycena olivaceomarginata]|nr:hypothetical protein B0H14DRAFT_3874506 [Mycena olivaceomarginata]